MSVEQPCALTLAHHGRRERPHHLQPLAQYAGSALERGFENLAASEHLPLVTDGVHRRSPKHTVVEDLIVKEDGRLYDGEPIENAKPRAEIALEERRPVPLTHLG
jgi:hypothetical protein